MEIGNENKNNDIKTNIYIYIWKMLYKEPHLPAAWECHCTWTKQAQLKDP
jgi:hypothetical protein